jgi:fructose-bisphosphate aldolase, class I
MHYTIFMIDLRERALAMVAPGKGILAADESNATADKRLASYGIEGGEENRRRDRELFLGTPGIGEYLSGVILFDETVNQKSDSGVLFPELVARQDISPGIKVDQGIEPISETSKETITSGLIGLPERLAAYAERGLQFTKWRAVIRIDGERLPTRHALVENAKRLAAYALASQRACLVPILEPEVLMEGRHSRLRAKAVITETLQVMFAALEDQAVDMSAILVKTAMAVSGKGSGKEDTPDEVALDTLEALVAAVPKKVPGIVFLSGGQTPDQATENLRAICALSRRMGEMWPLTFSFSRALQEEALAAWQGKEENLAAARTLFLKRLEKASQAVSDAVQSKV